MLRFRPVLDVGLEETPLLIDARVALGAAGPWREWVMVVIRPLREVVGKLEPRYIGSRVLKVNDDELLVLVGWLEKGRLLVVGLEAEDVAVLGLYGREVYVSDENIRRVQAKNLHRCAQRRAAR
jgi:hypothetical protein